MWSLGWWWSRSQMWRQPFQVGTGHRTWGRTVKKRKLMKRLIHLGCSGGSVVKNLPPVQKPQVIQVRSLGQEDALEEGMATHSSILAWRIPMDRGAWRATVHRVAKSWTQLKWLSTHLELKDVSPGFPDSPVLKNWPCNTRDTGLIHGPETSYFPQSNWASVPTATEPAL